MILLLKANQTKKELSIVNKLKYAIDEFQS